MTRLRRLARILLVPWWALQLCTGAKSFLDNPLIGSRRLNALGLHAARVRLAHAMTAWRRRRLSRDVPAQWQAELERQGYVVVEDAFPAEKFAAIREALLGYAAPAREMQQGNAITRRLAVDQPMLRSIPELRALLERTAIRALFRYVASFRVEPVHYIQTIVTHCASTETDPQEVLHADAFHPSMKAWLFLNDVEADAAPFTYVSGSHKLTDKRLDWERRRSQRPVTQLDRLTARGSPRIEPSDLPGLDLPPPAPLAVTANTLVVADTFGFHARGASTGPVERVEIWSYCRRNPFLPWLGGDILSLPGLAERRVAWAWALRDRFASLLGQPWRDVGTRTPAGDAFIR